MESTTKGWRWLAWVSTGVWAVLIALTQVGPDEATTRLRAWANGVSLPWPEGLTADDLLLAVGVVVVLAYALAFGEQIREFLGRFIPALRGKRPLPSASAESEPLSAPKRRGVVTEGGSFSAGKVRIKNQDEAIRSKDTETKIEDVDIE